jgi:hypothetical protein
MARFGLLLLVLTVSCFAATLPPCGPDADAYKRFLNQGEPYSLAACVGVDPKQYFEETKLDLEQTPTDWEAVRLQRMWIVAKAALEADMREEAKAYADQALALAAEGRFKNAPVPSSYAEAEGDAVFVGNLVLGRLALLRDDVEAAEMYLLRSGQIKAGQPTFWGPNLTLVRELMKRSRTKVVLQFMDEVKQFWREDCHGPEQADKLTQSILAGKLPSRSLAYF